MLGTLLSWNGITGIIRCKLFGKLYSFQYGHREDRADFHNGLLVVFAPEGNVALDVQSAAGAFQRYASTYTPS